MLFERELVRFTMRRSDGPALLPKTVARVRPLLDALEDSKDTSERRDWIAGAPLEVQELMIRSYFESLFAYLDQRATLAN